MFGGDAAGGAVGVGVGLHQAVRDEPGQGDLFVGVAGQERGLEPGSLPGGESVVRRRRVSRAR